MWCCQGSEENTNRGARLEEDFMSPTHEVVPSPPPHGDLENTRLSDVIRTCAQVCVHMCVC